MFHNIYPSSVRHVERLCRSFVYSTLEMLKKYFSIIPKFYIMKELALVNVYTKVLIKIQSAR